MERAGGVCRSEPRVYVNIGVHLFVGTQVIAVLRHVYISFQFGDIGVKNFKKKNKKHKKKKKKNSRMPLNKLIDIEKSRKRTLKAAGKRN